MNLIEFVAKWAPKDISKHNEFLSDTLEMAEEAMFQITKPILPVKPCGIGKKKENGESCCFVSGWAFSARSRRYLRDK